MEKVFHHEGTTDTKKEFMRKGAKENQLSFRQEGEIFLSPRIRLGMTGVAFS